MKKWQIIMSVLTLTMLLFVGCKSEEKAQISETGAQSDSSSVQGGDVPVTPDKVTLQLKWLPQSQFMGFYVADAKGYYAEEGIEIEILPGGADIIPEQQVYNGVADIGVTWVSTLMKYQEQGWELKHVAQTFQKSAMLLVSKAATGIETPADIVGKRVGSWFGGNEYEIYALLEANGIDRETDIELVQQDFTMNQILNDSIDAASAMTYNEYGLLLAAGLDASEINVLDMNDEGVAMLQDCLFVSEEWVKDNEDLLVRFLRASIKGWADASADPDGAGQIVFDVDNSVSLDHQIYMAGEVAKLVVPDGFDPANIGYTDLESLERTATIALNYGLLTTQADLSETTFDSNYYKLAIQ